MHNKPLTRLERDGLIAHGLERCIGKPSQIADIFRQGIAWAGMSPADRSDAVAARREIDKLLTKKGSKHD